MKRKISLVETFIAVISTIDIENMRMLIDIYDGDEEGSIIYQEALKNHIKMPCYKECRETIN